jgi:hypothetical protein
VPEHHGHGAARAGAQAGQVPLEARHGVVAHAAVVDAGQALPGQDAVVRVARAGGVGVGRWHRPGQHQATRAALLERAAAPGDALGRGAGVAADAEVVQGEQGGVGQRRRAGVLDLEHHHQRRRGHRPRGDDPLGQAQRAPGVDDADQAAAIVVAGRADRALAHPQVGARRRAAPGTGRT